MPFKVDKVYAELCFSLWLHFKFGVWRMRVEDWSMCQSKVLHWDALFLCYPCLNLELYLCVLFSVWCYLSLQTSDQIALIVYLNNWRVVYTCHSDVDKVVSWKRVKVFRFRFYITRGICSVCVGLCLHRWPLIQCCFLNCSDGHCMFL